jgi:hypothetical protein
MSVRLVAALLLGCVLFAGVMPGAAQAGPFVVQVGYADGIRPGGFFPNPWQGGAGVALFAGAGPTFDAGAVRIINTGSASIHINSLTVDHFANGASFSLWGSSLPFTLAPGKSAIFTQTIGTNFDTSDQPIHGPPSDGAIPQVHFMIDGTPFTFFDTGEVLNTNGFDFAVIGNESFRWRPIGGNGTPSGGVPEPASITLLAFGLASVICYGSWRRRRAA